MKTNNIKSQLKEKQEAAKLLKTELDTKKTESDRLDTEYEDAVEMRDKNTALLKSADVVKTAFEDFSNSELLNSKEQSLVTLKKQVSEQLRNMADTGLSQLREVQKTLTELNEKTAASLKDKVPVSKDLQLDLEKADKLTKKVWGDAVKAYSGTLGTIELVVALEHSLSKVDELLQGANELNSIETIKTCYNEVLGVSDEDLQGLESLATKAKSIFKEKDASYKKIEEEIAVITSLMG